FIHSVGQSDRIFQFERTVGLRDNAGLAEMAGWGIRAGRPPARGRACPRDLALGSGRPQPGEAPAAAVPLALPRPPRGPSRPRSRSMAVAMGGDFFPPWQTWL